MNRLTPNFACAALTPCPAACSSTSAFSLGVYRRAGRGFGAAIRFPLGADRTRFAGADRDSSAPLGARSAVLFTAPRASHELTVVCGTSCRRPASTTPTRFTVARTAARSSAVYRRRFRGSFAAAMLVLLETSAEPQTIRGFRPRSPWTMFGNGS
jgi:hypothetical protein